MHLSVSELALGWFPLCLGLEDEPSKLSNPQSVCMDMHSTIIIFTLAEYSTQLQQYVDR